ncbi:hypothetical protein RND71_021269 [Anisodus tanguticus]|uniref:Uncharacterized protein n=1 Tax=Anisodus tanguticus TaxID=243964 RepID=A0AAE1RWM4_9SOLA|nr:hypothetical protein RND71_021269 [Anisodus tanguticus]
MDSSSYELNAVYLNLLLFRPLLAIAFVISLLLLGWFLAWKLVLVHVPLVQEIFGKSGAINSILQQSSASHRCTCCTLPLVSCIIGSIWRGLFHHPQVVFVYGFALE